MTTQTEAQRLANAWHNARTNRARADAGDAMADELRRLEADFSQLMQKHNAMHINAQAHRERIAELEAEVQALRCAVPAWIATKDRMPPEGVRVFFMDTQYNRVGFDTYMGEGYTCTASHWMHIPAETAAPQPAQGEKQ